MHISFSVFILTLIGSKSLSSSDCPFSSSWLTWNINFELKYYDVRGCRIYTGYRHSEIATNLVFDGACARYLVELALVNFWSRFTVFFVPNLFDSVAKLDLFSQNFILLKMNSVEKFPVDLQWRTLNKVMASVHNVSETNVQCARENSSCVVFVHDIFH